MVVLAAAAWLAGCGGGGPGATKSTTAPGPVGGAVTTTNASKAGGSQVDVCSIITLAKFNAALGTTFDKSNATGIVTGGPTTDCEYSSSSGVLAGAVNYLSNDNLGEDVDHFPKEQKLQRADNAGGDCTAASIEGNCYQDVSGLGERAFAHVTMTNVIEVEVVAHKGAATLTVTVSLLQPSPSNGVPGGDPKKAIAGLIQLAHLVFP